MTGTRELSRRQGTTTHDARPIAPILIQVPTVRVVPHRTTGGPRTATRRRLKREFRWLGMILLVLGLPTAGFVLGTRSASPERDEPSAPLVTLSIEPIARVASRPERVASSTSPVELESTLLPVDGSEDPPHDEGR